MSVPSPPPASVPELLATPVQDSESADRSRRLSQQPLDPPGQVPGYQLDRRLGEGSFGSVWLARELKTGRQVAIKFYAQRRGLNWSLLSREVEKLAVLYTSRNIVGLLDVGWDHEPPYFVMEFLEAGSLAERLARGALPVDEAVRLATGVARALAHAHRSGILHCDLKPANVLLDLNGEPRLGDFGQSRLTTEQSPSLGTLYYMAPEQAVPDGVSDVRWDVYALGALLYHMLTGAPPYASPEADATLAAERHLPDRLAAYRALIRNSPRPSAHRRVAGVDQALGDVVDACLDPHADSRVGSLQRVLDLLETRERVRHRRPLVLLGFLGPILFLAAMYWLAESSVPYVVAAAEQNLVDRALASDAVSARILAASVQQELNSRQSELVQVAQATELIDLIENSGSLSDDQLLRLCLGETVNTPTADGAYHWLCELFATTQGELSTDDRTADDSWFVTDARGRQVFRLPAREPDRQTTLGKPFHWRDYFHAQGRELDPSTPLASTPPRKQPGLSTPFRSQATGEYMVAIAVPVTRAGSDEVIGVLARTIRLTALLQQWEIRLKEPSVRSSSAEGPLRFLVLADTRGPAARLLDHPGMTHPEVAQRSDAEVARLLQLPTEPAAHLLADFRSDRFRDPLGELLPEYRGEWLAAAAPVGNTGWLAIVQERRDQTVQPVDALRRVFQRAGFWAIGVFGTLLLILWWLIRRVPA